MPADLTTLLTQAHEYATRSHALNTRINYTADWKHFTHWCEEHGRQFLPATHETLLCYLVACTEHYAVATIDRHLSAVSYFHRQERYELPTKHPEVLRTMRGIRRDKGVAPAGKAALTLSLLRAMLAALPNDERGVRDAALLLVGFAGAFRQSELVSLRVSDVECVEQGMILTLRRSKTDQEGEGEAKGIPFGKELATCPVRALQTWLVVGNISDGPVFRPIGRYGTIGAGAMHNAGVSRVVKQAIARINRDPSEYSGHSLRAGLVTAAAVAGVNERVIMRQTGHRDPRTLRRYIREGKLFRENAAGEVGL